MRANPISVSVPYEPPTAITASPDAATMALRACPSPVTTTWSIHSLASPRFDPGRIPIVVPPPNFAPRAAAAITSPRPPQTTVHPRSASNRPTSSARATCSAPLPITLTWTATLRPDTPPLRLHERLRAVERHEVDPRLVDAAAAGGRRKLDDRAAVLRPPVCDRHGCVPQTLAEDGLRHAGASTHEERDRNLALRRPLREQHLAVGRGIGAGPVPDLSALGSLRRQHGRRGVRDRLGRHLAAAPADEEHDSESE